MLIEFLQYSEKKVAEEYFWVITQVMGQACCGLSGYTVLELRFQCDILVYTYVVDHMCTEF
jgi:hypothetical protein